MMNITYQIKYSLIGAFLKGGLTAKAREVLGWLEPEMFATYQLGIIYSHIRQQARRDNYIDLITLNSDFGEDDRNDPQRKPTRQGLDTQTTEREVISALSQR